MRYREVRKKGGGGGGMGWEELYDFDWEREISVW